MKEDTLLAHLGRDSENNFGIVNPPVYRASTVLFPTLEAFLDRKNRQPPNFSYGTQGTPTVFALTDAIAELEGGFGTIATSSGLSAVTMALLAFLDAGDHLLVVDTAYEPTRSFCEKVLKRYGVETSYYDPLIGDGIGALIRPETRAILAESPGSLTFEVQDIPAIARAAREKGVALLLDNTWGTPLYFKAFEHGVDVSIHAGTKYVSGHSDLLLGLITARTEEHYKRIRSTMLTIGDCVSPDVCFMALRGLRTMSVRLRQQSQSALTIARWLQQQPEVKRVLFPPLPDDPGHALWKRDFLGHCGLFGLLLHTSDQQAVGKMLDGLKLFGIGASWGGYESLIIPGLPGQVRTAVPWQEAGYLVRLSIGLEAVEDLQEDLRAGLDRLGQQ